MRAKVNPRVLLFHAKTEDELQKAIIATAEQMGWLVHHCKPARMQSGRMATPIDGHAGFPDLVLVRAPRVIFAELKSAKGRTSDDQEMWLEATGGCDGVETHVWRPADAGAILAALGLDLG